MDLLAVSAEMPVAAVVAGDARFVGSVCLSRHDGAQFALASVLVIVVDAVLCSAAAGGSASPGAGAGPVPLLACQIAAGLPGFWLA